MFRDEFHVYDEDLKGFQTLLGMWGGVWVKPEACPGYTFICPLNVFFLYDFDSSKGLYSVQEG